MEAKTKIEKEIEIHTLTLEVALNDGTFGRVFSRNERNEAGLFIYTCHVCSVSVLPGEACLVNVYIFTSISRNLIGFSCSKLT